MMKPTRSLLLPLTVSLLAPALPAMAQVPALEQAPRIKSVFPPGVLDHQRASLLAGPQPDAGMAREGLAQRFQAVAGLTGLTGPPRPDLCEKPRSRVGLGERGERGHQPPTAARAGRSPAQVRKKCSLLLS